MAKKNICHVERIWKPTNQHCKTTLCLARAAIPQLFCPQKTQELCISNPVKVDWKSEAPHLLIAAAPQTNQGPGIGIMESSGENWNNLSPTGILDFPEIFGVPFLFPKSYLKWGFRWTGGCRFGPESKAPTCVPFQLYRISFPVPEPNQPENNPANH